MTDYNIMISLVKDLRLTYASNHAENLKLQNLDTDYGVPGDSVAKLTGMDTCNVANKEGGGKKP